MQQQEKVQLKECAMQLLSNVSAKRVDICLVVQKKICLTDLTPVLVDQGTHSILEEESHIKDVLSRIIVEMIKREWPQHWPDMLKEMEALTSQGVSNFCNAGNCLLL